MFVFILVHTVDYVQYRVYYVTWFPLLLAVIPSHADFHTSCLLLKQYRQFRFSKNTHGKIYM